MHNIKHAIAESRFAIVRLPEPLKGYVHQPWCNGTCGNACNGDQDLVTLLIQIWQMNRCKGGF